MTPEAATKTIYVAEAAGAIVLGVTWDDIALALGIAVPLAEFVTGMVYAIAGGFVALAITPPKESRWTVWQTLIVAMFIGLMVGIIYPKITEIDWLAFAAALPVQAAMGLSGVASRRGLLLVRNIGWMRP